MQPAHTHGHPEHALYFFFLTTVENVQPSQPTPSWENAFRYLEGWMQPIPGEDPELEYAGADDD